MTFQIFFFFCYRRSLPQNLMTVKCDSVNTLSPHTRVLENHYSNLHLNAVSSPSSRSEEKSSSGIAFGGGDYYLVVRGGGGSGGGGGGSVDAQLEDVKNSECEDSSTLSDEDCTPHVSRSNSRGNEVVTNSSRYSPAATAATGPHSETCIVRGRMKRREDRAAHRSRSLPPPPPYRPPPPATSRRAPITSYYLGDCNNQMQKYVITRAYMDEESYV